MLRKGCALGIGEHDRQAEGVIRVNSVKCEKCESARQRPVPNRQTLAPSAAMSTGGGGSKVRDTSNLGTQKSMMSEANQTSVSDSSVDRHLEWPFNRPPQLSSGDLRGDSDGSMCRPSPTFCAEPLSEPGQIAADFDPCAVDVLEATNAQVLYYWLSVNSYVQNRSRGQDRYFDYLNLRRRLAEERRRRVRMGHAWLGDSTLQAVPARLYEIVPGQDSTATIQIADTKDEAGKPRSRTSAVVTPDQFQHFLAANHIPQLNVENWYAHQAPGTYDPLQVVLPSPPEVPTMALLPADSYGPQSLLRGWPLPGIFGVGGSGLTGAPFDLFGRGQFLGPVYSSNVTMGSPLSRAGAELQWRGALPEVSMMRQSYIDLLRYRDLNLVQPNFPVFDSARRLGARDVISITHSLPAANGQLDMSHYATKVRTMSGDYDPRGTNRLGQAIGLLNQEFGTQWNVADINERNFLAVPDDHVTSVQDAMEARITRQPSAYANMVDALLRQNPITIGGRTYNSWNQVVAGRNMGVINDADYLTIRRHAGRNFRSRVIGCGTTVAQIVEMLEIRSQLQLRGFSPSQASAIATPEVLQMRRLMAAGASRNQAINIVARESALRGVGMGAGLSALTGAIQIALSDGTDPNLWQRTGLGVGLSAAGGYGQAFVEAQATTRLLDPLLTRATGPAVGSTGALTAGGIMSRGLGSSGAGAIVAPAVTWLGMGADELWFGADYYSGDYKAKGARSAVSGGIASGGGALAAGITGAVLGTEVPILGNIIGFGVGIGIYYLVDSTIGEEIEESIRISAGEQGCVQGVSEVCQEPQ